MKKYIMRCSISCMGGTDGIEAVAFPEETPHEQMMNEAWQWALQWAESFGFYDEIEDEDGEEPWSASDYLDAWIEEYDPEKHDMKKPGGGAWTDEDFCIR